MDFVIVNDKLRRETFCETVPQLMPEFAKSAGYQQLVTDDIDDISSCVMFEVGRYLVRDDLTESGLHEAATVLERFVSKTHSDIAMLIAEEIFWPLDLYSPTAKVLSSRLAAFPKLTEMFEAMVHDFKTGR